MEQTLQETALLSRPSTKANAMLGLRSSPELETGPSGLIHLHFGFLMRLDALVRNPTESAMGMRSAVMTTGMTTRHLSSQSPLWQAVKELACDLSRDIA